MLKDVMLPYARLAAKDTISESAEEAKGALLNECPGRNLDHLVAKVDTSCRAMGVFFVKKDEETKNWITPNDGEKISDENGKKKSGIKKGEVLRWEPYLEVLQKEDWRIYKYMSTNYTKSGMVNLYAVQTELMNNGLIHVRRTPFASIRKKQSNRD